MQQDSKIFHFGDSYDEERIRTKEAQFKNEFYSKSGNWSSDYYKEFMKNMTGFGFNTYEQNGLKNQIHKLRYQLHERKEFVRTQASDNNPYRKNVDDSKSSLNELKNQLESIEKQGMQKSNQIIELHNRKMYQMFPQRFESVEKILIQEAKDLRIQKEKLKIHLDVAECKFDSLNERYFSYDKESLEDDIELIRLRINLEKLEQQLNNPNNIEIESLYNQVFNLECSIVKRKIELRQYIEENNSYPDKMTEIGENLAELLIEKMNLFLKFLKKIVILIIFVMIC